MNILDNKTVYLENYGCDKNTVNGEYILGSFERSGYTIVDNPDKADIIIINTCSFILPAREESLDSIFSYIYEKENRDFVLIVAGCMTERYAEELQQELPEVDYFVTPENYLEKLEPLLKAEVPVARLKTNTPFKFLKIAEGCDKHCTFCAIPTFKGNYKSRKPDEIFTELRELEGTGELILVAQDLTAYGKDLEEDIDLVKLLKRISEEFDFKWIRLLYLYPEGITEELLDLIARDERILPYFDIPIQHTDDKILKRMGRDFKREQIFSLFNRIRERLPGAVIRTTLITGFPGEDEESFNRLIEDLKILRPDRFGAFSYSPEEGTPAALFDGQVAEDLKQQRLEKIEQLSQEILKEKTTALTGKTVETIVEQRLSENEYQGRTKQDAPEVDTSLFFNSQRDLEPGEFVNVKIINSFGSDLIGDLNESSE